MNAAVAVAIDPSGNVVVTGYTTSQTLPGTANAFQPTKAAGLPNNTDVFVAKFDPTGRTLLWATFLGGDGDEAPVAVSTDAAGSIYVVGFTQSSNFPITSGAFEKTNGGESFVSKLSADGSRLVYSTGLPGAQATALAVGGGGNAYVVGSFSPFPGTAGTGLVTAGAINLGTGLSVFQCVFLVELNASGTGLVFGANLGGGGQLNGSWPWSVALDGNGSVYVAGSSLVDSIPTTPDALQTKFSNDGLNAEFVNNGFVLKTNSAGSQILYGTYFGPQYANTTISNVAVTPAGDIYFAGLTNGTSMQATVGAFLSAPGGGFIARFSAGSPTLSAFTYLPNPPTDCGGSGYFPGACATGALSIASQSQTAYAVFQIPGYQGAEMIELNMPSLSASSQNPSFTFSQPTGFYPVGIGFAAPSSVWVVGACAQCSLGNLISSGAFQPVPQSDTQNVVLLQLTDIAPTISFVGSSATGSSPFAAGQLISIYGTQLGPTPGSVGQENANGAVTNSDGGTQVLFDGVAAPILYSDATQINTAVPCSVAGKASTQMVVQYLGASSSPFTVPLSAAAPGIFTINGSGSGEAVVLNQDYTLNGPSNPAARGSAVSFYATGIGPTSPCVDGQTYQANFPLATLPVIAGVGNLGAQVLYAGQAPYFMSGVDQINIVIPSGSPTGSVPLALLVNGVFSPPGVTIAVK